MWRREGEVLAAELRRSILRQAAAGGTNRLTERLGTQNFVPRKGKQDVELGQLAS